MGKILGIGNALVDVMTLITDDSILEKFDLPKGSMQLVDNIKSDLVKSGTKEFKNTLASGGSSANTIYGLAMLGAETGFIGSIGKDEMGDFFENDMKKAGINTILLRRESVTGTAVAMISPDSERTFATHLGAAIELQASDLKKEHYIGYDILYLEGYLLINKFLVETACKIAKSLNMKIALDMASYNVVEAILEDFKEITEKYVDIVFANEEEAKAFSGLEPAQAVAYLSNYCEVAVVKLGKNGSLIRRGEQQVNIKTDEVRLKDTTGAGDSYASGFLYGYAKGLDLKKCGLIATLMAGKVIEIVGARMDELKFKEINEAVKKIEENN